MHSYWDDFFALRGFKDAAWLAGAARQAGAARRSSATATSSRATSARSIAAAMAAKDIDYVPGCADLGDFDATTTSIALNPVDAGRRASCRARRSSARSRSTGTSSRSARAAPEPWDALHALRVAQRRRHRAPRLARPRAGGAAVVHAVPPPARLPALGRGGLARRARAALHRRHAAHVGGHGLRAQRARHAGVRARGGQLARGRRGRARPRGSRATAWS